MSEVADDHFFLRAHHRRDSRRFATDLATMRRTDNSRAAQLRDRSIMAAKSRSRSSNSSIGMVSPCAAAICAVINRIGSICSAGPPMRADPTKRLPEEKRPRWGVRTSNPGGAASRSLVGSTPSLFRHVHKTSASSSRLSQLYFQLTSVGLPPGRIRINACNEVS